MPEAGVMFYAQQLVMALEHLEQRGIIHRDIKPENCLIGSNGYMMLSDFGLSTALGAPDTSGKCDAGIVFGTPQVKACDV